MLRVTVELIPHGNENQKSTIGLMEIVNDKTGTEYLGNYYYSLGNTETINSGKYNGFNRSLGFWRLIERILTKYLDFGG
jgi:hypothetical protein